MIQFKGTRLLVAGCITVLLSAIGVFCAFACEASGYREAASRLTFNSGVLVGIGITCLVLLLVGKKVA